MAFPKPDIEIKEDFPFQPDISQNMTVRDETIRDDIKPVSSLSSKDGISTILQDKSYLDKSYPIVKPQEQIQVSAKTTEEPELPQIPIEEAPQEEGLSLDEAAELFGDDFTGLKQVNGKWVPDASAWARAGIKGVETPEEINVSVAEQDLSELDSQMAYIYTQFDDYNVDTDPAFQSYSQNIRNQYSQMRNDMARINQSRENAIQTLGYRTGSTQYAGSIMQGIVGEELSQGNRRIADINMQESIAVSNARQSFENNNWDKFSKQMSALKDIRENKASELQRYSQKLADINTKLQEQSKLELEVAKYYSDLDWKNANLELEYDKLYKTDAVKPITLSPGQTIYDPVSGESLFTAPERPSDNKPTIEKIGNSLLQYNPATGGWDNVYTASGSEEDLTPLSAADIKTYASLGYDVKPGMTKADLNAIKKLPPNQAKLDAAQKEVDDVNQILNHPGFNESVGPNPFARRLFNWNEFINSNAGNFVAKVEQIISQKSLSSLIDAKARGATFGALSDTEMTILTKAATELGNLRKYRDNDPTKDVVGYRTTENNFNRIMKEIQDSANKIIDYAEKERQEGVIEQSPADKLDNYYIKNPNQRGYIDQLDQEGYSDEEKLQILGEVSFNQVGNDTNEVVKISQAIGQFESGGNYKAIGPKTKSGDKAYGKYQIMGNNIPSWSKEALGKSVTPQEFLNNPELQDKIAQYKMKQYFDKYGNVEDVASVWFSGRPVAKAGNDKDVLGTSVPQYIKNIRSLYNKLG